MASLFEEIGGTYTLGADVMYYPNPERPEEETLRYGKYGRMRHTYLREHKKAYYTILLFDGKLVAHLNEIDDAANTRMELVTKQMAKSQGITEQLKAQDQTAWVGAKNNIRNAAEETVCSFVTVCPAEYARKAPASRRYFSTVAALFSSRIKFSRNAFRCWGDSILSVIGHSSCWIKCVITPLFYPTPKEPLNKSSTAEQRIFCSLSAVWKIGNT